MVPRIQFGPQPLIQDRMTSQPVAASPSASPVALPLAAAPMAGLTHSAFRRLVGELGGCDVLYTEMLAGTRLLVERPGSPYLKRRPGDGKVIYQLLLRDARRIPEIIDRLRPCAPDGVDLNCACPATAIQATGGGAGLLDDAPRLESILRELRRAWAGPLSVKIRLGKSPEPHWRERFSERLRLFRECGVDRLTINPRFAADRLARPARHTLLPWVCAEAGLPVTANGDITGPESVSAHPELFAGCTGLMLGRMAVARPWVFAAWRGGAGYAAPDAVALWRRLAAYIMEDFPAEQVASRLRLFTGWYSRNFVFGHLLAGQVRHVDDAKELIRRAEAFFATAPAQTPTPSLYDL